MNTSLSTKRHEPSAIKEMLCLAHGAWNMGQRSRKLVLELSPSSLTLVFFRGGKIESWERFLLRENSEESLQKSIASFIKGKKFRDSLLLLPRSEVISKELVLTQDNGSSLKDLLEKKLESLLPYSPKEMAFGFSFEREGEELKGEVLAIPEKNLKETLSFLERLGLHPDEIVTEDEPLLWLLLERKEKGPLLLLDRNEGRLLTLFLKGEKFSFVRTFSHKDHPHLQDLLPELSLALLERGARPEKILLSGEWEKDSEEEISKHFRSPFERLKPEGVGEDGIALSFYGSVHLGKYPLVSLLTREEKIKKWTKERKRLIRDTLASFLLFLSSLFLLSYLHLQGLEREASALDQKLQSLMPQVRETKSILASLEILSHSHASKEKLLLLLKELSQKIPSSVRLKELRIEAKDFLFKGESPSHAYLSETVQVLEKLPMLEGVRLEETRLRKRLNEDYFEFEIKGKWRGSE